MPANNRSVREGLIGNHSPEAVAQKLLALSEADQKTLSEILERSCRLSLEDCAKADFLDGMDGDSLMQVSSDLGELSFHPDPASRKEIFKTIASRLNY